MSETIELPDRIRLPLAFDPARLRADLNALAGESWTAHFVRQNYACDWSVLPLRGVEQIRYESRAWAMSCRCPAG